MFTYTVKKLAWIVLFCFVLLGHNPITHAADDSLIVVSTTFTPAVIGIGQSSYLSIYIANLHPNPVNITSLKCTQSGTSASAAVIIQKPSTIDTNGNFQTAQFYKGLSRGTVFVHCDVTATDAVTGETTTSTGGTLTLDVIPEMQLYFTADSVTKEVTVGQDIDVVTKFGNRGKVSFTDLDISCVELGRSLVSTTETDLQSSLASGESGQQDFKWQAATVGAGPISCIFTAADSVTGKRVSLSAPLIQITVK